MNEVAIVEKLRKDRIDVCIVYAWSEGIRAALTATSISIPVRLGKLALGTWQGLYVFEHRDAPHRREILLHLIGD